MGRVLVVTDSSACLHSTAAAGDHLHIVPISIHFGDADTTDTEIEPEHVFRAMRRDEPVKSTAPTLLDYLRAAEHGEYDAAVILTPAAGFTRMAANAGRAADLSNRQVHVIDTRTAAVAQGLVVQAAVDAARQGGDAAAVVAAARRCADRVDLLAALGTTDSIERSGRLPAGTLNDVADQPLFRFHDGVVAALEEPGEPLDAIENVWRRGGGQAAATAAVFHAGAEDAARQLAARLDVAAAPVKFSPAMAIHTGPGLVGVAWVKSS